MTLHPSAMLRGEHVIFRGPVEELKMYVWYPESHGQRAVAVVSTNPEDAKEAADAFVKNVNHDERYYYDDWTNQERYTQRVFGPGEVAVFDND